MLDFPMMRIVKIVHPAEFAQQFIRWDSKKGIRSLELYRKKIFKQNIGKLAHIRMDFAGIMQTIGIKGRYVGFTYIRPLYGFAPFWRS